MSDTPLYDLCSRDYNLTPQQIASTIRRYLVERFPGPDGQSCARIRDTDTGASVFFVTTRSHWTINQTLECELVKLARRESKDGR